MKEMKWEWQVETRSERSSHAAPEFDFGTAAVTGEQCVSTSQSQGGKKKRFPKVEKG